MLKPVILEEIRHLVRTMSTIPAAHGTYYVADLLHRIAEIGDGEARRIFEVHLKDDEGRALYGSLYILLSAGRAVVFQERSSPHLPAERHEVWLCMERLMGEA